MRGTVVLNTERMRLRRYVMEDAPLLYSYFGKNEKMHEYTGWNPCATEEMAKETVAEFIKAYDTDSRDYSWVMEADGEFIGIISAYDYNTLEDSIEVGLSVRQDRWGQGYGSEALGKVLEYLSEEGIKNIRAWCAAGNIGSAKAMEKSGMRYTHTEKDGLNIDGLYHDKYYFEYGLTGVEN